MRCLPITLDSPAANLALDELLLAAPSSGAAPATLRLWEAPEPMVVVGRASRLDEEVDTESCAQLGVPVLRRVSGGATIVCGPGCLMYAVALPLADLGQPEGSHLEALDACHTAVLDPIAAALRHLEPSVVVAGTSDLAYQPAGAATLRKFSGNSLRVTRGRLLYHGTLLYDFDLSLVPRLLREPPRQPDYRETRSHDQFVANLPVDRQRLVDALKGAWPIAETTDRLEESDLRTVQSLVVERYDQPAWNAAR